MAIFAGRQEIIDCLLKIFLLQAQAMTPMEFSATLELLGLSKVQAAGLLGMSERQLFVLRSETCRPQHSHPHGCCVGRAATMGAPYGPATAKNP
jgi:hypothetical protein